MSLQSGTGAITVITSESQHYLRCSPLSQAGDCVAWSGECSYLVLSFTFSSSPFTSLAHFCLLIRSPLFIVSLLSNLQVSMNSGLFLFSPTSTHVQPYLVLLVKPNSFQWDGNQMKGNHAVTVQLLLVPPHPILFIDCEPQTRQMLSLYASSTSSIHLPFRNS